ncbi:hypothetical protein VC83_03046 [Pseudogymnoascus destructans]|uniref:Uncharacterized protein n=1 Tax=Pseudogymnoascus destructans TaxID=655981 RepID=A0A177AFH3_9PEZI|nr:uncharacterized protein VC83_03046 [Pseudogymnoascus destructans]OAF59923.1 hypothetical protein VC83_03046 [Pseudogymnoascus destructans]
MSRQPCTKSASKWRQEEPLDGSRRLPSQDKDYKKQLDGAATNERRSREESIVEKAASYIPGVSIVQSAIQGKHGASTSEAKVEDVGKPLTRPANDVQVEEFLKEQCRSRSTDEDTPKPDEG